MKIGINGFFLTKPKTGIGQYNIHILEKLLQTTTHEWVIYVPKDSESHVRSDIPKHILTRIEFISMAWKRQDLIRQAIWEAWIFPKYSRGCDIIWSPYQSLSWISNRPFVMTIHDVIPWRLSAYIPTWKQHLYFIGLKQSLRRANHIITISKFCKKEIQSVLKRNPRDISVTYLASTKQHPKSIYTHVKHAKYCLYVGGLDLRKNVPRLIDAFAEVIKDQPDVHLYIPGNYFANPLIPNIPAQIVDRGLTSHVHLLGYISDEELSGLLEKAQMLIYPSLYEGFGLPILEGMQYHIPVITSDLGAMKETASNAAYLVNPYKSRDIAKGIQSLLTDTALRKRLIQRGKKRVQDFSWENAAQETMKILEEQYRLQK